MDFKTDLIGLIRKELKKRGMTQKELAERAGVTQASVSRYMTGYYYPRLDAAIMLCEVFGWKLIIETDGDRR